MLLNAPASILKILLKSGFLLVFLSACSSTLMQQETSVAAFKRGELNQAETILTKTISKEMPKGNFQECHEAVCLLLNRATMRFIAGKTEESIIDYNLAIEAMDYYSQDSTLDMAGQLLLEDGNAAYCGSDLEHLLARIYFALALLHQGDINNANAILRQAEEMQQNKAKGYADIPYLSGTHCNENALGKFLFGVLLEQQGDTSNAAILLKQAHTLAGSLPEEVDLTPKSSSSKAKVIFICHNGNVPFKISATSPASIASTLVLEAILCTKRIDPAWSSLTGIPTPLLCQRRQSEPLPTCAILNEAVIPLSPWFNVAQAATEELEQTKPIIVARGVARYLLRRAAVAQAQKQDPRLGALMDIGMLIANANTEADTRSWTTLPSSFDIAQCVLPPGEHNVTISVSRFKQEVQLKLKPGDLCIVNIFNINPQKTIILVPLRFQIKETH